MTREDAKRQLAEIERSGLSVEKAGELLLDWWGIDADDEEFGLLPSALQEEIETTDEPAGHSLEPRYVPLLLIALRAELTGVTNRYLHARLSAVDRDGVVEVSVEVTGEVEPMERCPSCSYLTFPDRGEYDICPVCFWEDDGTEDADKHSDCNHMSLREARVRVAEFGVVEERFKGAVADDARERYEYGGD
jgi:hypothetical protein